MMPEQGRGPKPRLAAPVLAATAAVAVLLLLSGSTTPCEAKILSLRMTNLTSLSGFQALDNVITTPTCGLAYNTIQKGCKTPCVSLTGAEPFFNNPSYPATACIVAASPYCEAASGGGDWCSMEVELEATMDLPGSTSSDRVMKMQTTARPIISIQKISGPTYVSATSVIPENRARWRYQVSSSLTVYDQIVTFAAAQGNNERSINYHLSFSCMPSPDQEHLDTTMRLDAPKVNCSDGTIRANGTVTGCPKFGAYGGDLTRDLAVFDRLVQEQYISDVFPDVGIYEGDPPLELNDNLYPEFVAGGPTYSYVNTTGPGKIEVVLKRKLVTDSATYPYPRAPWPRRADGSLVDGVKLGYRYYSWSDDNERPNEYNLYYLTKPVFYKDGDNDGFGVSSQPATTTGICDCRDTDPAKTKTC